MIEKYKSSSNIFTGWLYPLIVAALVLAGSLTGLEVYFGLVNIILVSVALVISNTIKPFLFFLITFAYQMPAVHLYPSDYYTTGPRPYLLVGSLIILAAALVTFIVKNEIFHRAKVTKIPLFIPLCVLSVGMLLNGIGSADYKPMNLVWALLMMLVYFFLYIVVYLGLKYDDPYELAQYFTYMTLLTSWILIIQMGKIYFVDGVLVDGVLDRGKIVTGYGVCTLIGFHISTLIPVNFYGFMRGKAPALSLITAILVWIASIATTSRNAAIFSTIYFIICLIYAMIEGERVRGARIFGASLSGALLLLIAIFSFYYANPGLVPNGAFGGIISNVNGVVRQYIERGMNSSGRMEIWKHCVQIFKENPIFGTGFFGMQVSPQFVPQEFIPEYAHNTFFELIGATGIVGTLAYGFYRIATVRFLFDKFSPERFMLILGASVLAVESLLDNYVFQVYTTFYYVIAFAICALLYDEVRVPKCAGLYVLDTTELHKKYNYK